MNTYQCCPCCRVPTHHGSALRWARSQPFRDDHAWPCAKCPPDGPGRQLVGDAHLPWPARAS